MFGAGFLDGGVAGVEGVGADGVEGEVDVVVGVEPAAPEPVEVDAAGVFHGAEEVGGVGAFEGPALGVGFEGVVEEFAAEDGFAEEVEGDGGFAVGVGAELSDGFAVGHDGDLAVAGHVANHVTGFGAARGVVFFPLLFGEGLHEGVEAFVHPGPLALVGVDDHGEVVVADFVDDDGDEGVFGGAAVGAVFGGAGAVEADHGVFHAADGAVDGLGDGVGIREGVFRINIERVDDGVGGVFRPERLGFVRVERHRHDGLFGVGGGVVGRAHGVPDEFTGGGEGEVADVVGFEDPGFGAGGFAGFGGFGFGGGDDEDGLGRGGGGFEAGALRGGEDLLGVLQDAGGGDDVVARDGEADEVIAELEGEFAAAEVLFVLPAHGVVVGGHAGEPLGDFVEVVFVFLEIFVAAAQGEELGVVDEVGPGDLEGGLGAGGEGRGQVDAHHGFHNRVREGGAGGVGDGGDF